MIKQNIPQKKKEQSPLVSAADIAKDYSISSRFVLKLAEEGEIPSVRIGKKCIRFNAAAVAEALMSNDSKRNQ